MPVAGSMHDWSETCVGASLGRCSRLSVISLMDVVFLGSVGLGTGIHFELLLHVDGQCRRVGGDLGHTDYWPVVFVVTLLGGDVTGKDAAGS